MRENASPLLLCITSLGMSNTVRAIRMKFTDSSPIARKRHAFSIRRAIEFVTDTAASQSGLCIG